MSTAVGLMYNLVSGWMSTSDRTSRSNSNTSGDDTVSAGGVEESGGDEQDGLDDWVHINQVPMLQHESAHSGSDLDSESESDSINSASSSEFEFHDTTSYDERESHD